MNVQRVHVLCLLFYAVEPFAPSASVSSMYHLHRQPFLRSQKTTIRDRAALVSSSIAVGTGGSTDNGRTGVLSITKGSSFVDSGIPSTVANDKGGPTPPPLPPLAVEDEWIASMDLEAFKADMKALSRELFNGQGPADLAHLRKLCFWSNACGVLGVAGMGLRPNPLTVGLLSVWTFTRWAVVAHHTCHGGYNSVVDGGGSGHKEQQQQQWFHSRSFAVGSLRRRCRQWLDWMLPEAWSLEHNQLHHYRLGEAGDPDLVQRNLEFMREMKAPKAVKLLGVAFLMATWK